MRSAPRTSSMTQRISVNYTPLVDKSCVLSRGIPLPGRGHYNTFSDLRCNVACLFERYVRPNYTAEILLTLWSTFRRSAAAGPHGRGAVRSAVRGRRPVAGAYSRVRRRKGYYTYAPFSTRGSFARRHGPERKQSAMIPRPMRMRCASRLASCKAAPLGPLRSIVRRVCF